jgi:hypothetical protein
MNSSALTPRAYSTRELQAAAAALAGGRFATAMAAETTCQDATQPDAATHQPLCEAAASSALRTVVEPTETCGPAPLVRVRAANSGAGASTIALMLADAADAAGVRARILDAAAPTWSGLLGATATEEGAAHGWRRGRRGASVLIDRVEDPVRSPTQVPTPRAVDGVDLNVLDAGWSMRELTAASSAWLTTAPVGVEVLVTRSHNLALSQTEAALAELTARLHAGHVIVVVVGAARWGDREYTTAGPRLRAAYEQDAVLLTPLVPARALSGLGPEPLPKQLTTSSQRLLQRVTQITGPLTAYRA